MWSLRRSTATKLTSSGCTFGGGKESLKGQQDEGDRRSWGDITKFNVIGLRTASAAPLQLKKECQCHIDGPAAGVVVPCRHLNLICRIGAPGWKQ